MRLQVLLCACVAWLAASSVPASASDLTPLRAVASDITAPGAIRSDVTPPGPVGSDVTPLCAAIAAPLVRWEDLALFPGRYLGKTVRIDLQFHSLPATWNPFMTRFGQRQYIAVDAWADEQFPWNPADFVAPAARVFARRDSAAQAALSIGQRSGRFEVIAVVREVFLDRPWVEVLDARPLVESIGEGTVIHVRRALELVETNAWKLAEAEFDRALSAALPTAAQMELMRLRELCRTQAAAPKVPAGGDSVRRDG